MIRWSIRREEKMIESDKPSDTKVSIRQAIRKLRESNDGPLHKFWYYLFVVSIITILLTFLALLNAYLDFANMSSYDITRGGISSEILFAGYSGMFISIVLLPIPDYFLIPAYGYLSSIGIFNPYVTFLVCLIAAILPIEYLPGRFVGRPLLLKGVSYFGISEKGVETAEKWLKEHGRFSIFISTFIPFFYSVTSLAAGMLKMNAGEFLLASALGFGLRYAILEFIGYNSIFIFTSSFDYSQRVLLALLLLLSSLYAALYLVGRSRSARRISAS